MPREIPSSGCGRGELHHPDLEEEKPLNEAFSEAVQLAGKGEDGQMIILSLLHTTPRSVGLTATDFIQQQMINFGEDCDLGAES